MDYVTSFFKFGDIRNSLLLIILKCKCADFLLSESGRITVVFVEYFWWPATDDCNNANCNASLDGPPTGCYRDGTRLQQGSHVLSCNRILDSYQGAIDRRAHRLRCHAILRPSPPPPRTFRARSTTAHSTAAHTQPISAPDLELWPVACAQSHCSHPCPIRVHLRCV